MLPETKKQDIKKACELYLEFSVGKFKKTLDSKLLREIADDKKMEKYN